MEVMELSSSTTDLNINGYKMYAIIIDGVVGKEIFAKSKEEAESFYANSTAILMTLENSPAFAGGKYDGEKFHPMEVTNE